MSTYKQQLITALRERLHLSETDATDDEIFIKTKGTFLRAGVEMHIALHDFMQAVANAGKNFRSAMKGP